MLAEADVMPTACFSWAPRTQDARLVAEDQVRAAAGGSYAILPENLLPDSDEASPDALVDYVLADITDPCVFKKKPEVDEMILAHSNRATNTSSQS